ncbi:tetratricopeptide repeat protein [Maribacter sp. 2307ULW6-5]|uniref:tetratricopeptide repeat protein n=1 Tax=Maribacter sp. 2307ULW6-5 TaxID=3386275 RepID=UPI0039BD18E6
MKMVFIFLLMCGLGLVPHHSRAQEDQELRVEESAEVFLEEYSDDFQEHFFEALKQKGIQNHDRAINALLECKRLQPENPVVDHELAKAHFMEKDYANAQAYGIAALSAEPERYWYLNTLVSALRAQGNTLSMVADAIPMDNRALQENLARVYFSKKDYDAALKVVAPLTDVEPMAVLEQKIRDAKAKKEARTQTFSVQGTATRDQGNTVASYTNRIKGLIGMPNAQERLLQVAEEALESYPAQAYFYYAHGVALNRKGKHRDAAEVLESALDFLVNDLSLANDVYRELVTAYEALSNHPMATRYRNRIKPGF